MSRIRPTADDALYESPSPPRLRTRTVIALFGRWYDRLAQRVGQATAAAIVLALAAGAWLVLGWMLGDW